ncbi:BID domain-containing T4SS effector [Bartonella taylorii]|uniref:BID domain-containing T4SS effector n=1 Tax=Bartonella taylorii TaxID=33046 RepID=UPI001ABB1660|nr:BID domain-containing T4SS effector [Bartonella taylorii]
MTKEKAKNTASRTQKELQKYHRSLDPEIRKRLKTEEQNFFYPGSGVYKNKYRITKQKELNDACARDAKKVMESLRAAPLPEKIDSSYLKSLHQQIFSKTFEWAGQTRDERFTFADGSVASMPFLKKKKFTKPFATGEEIQRGLQKLDEMLLEKGDLQNLTREEFIEHTSQIMLHLYSLNPFREGNRRAIQLFVEKLGQKAGHQLYYSSVSKKRKDFVRAEAVNNGNQSPIKHLLEDITNIDKVMLLDEFTNSMRKLGLSDSNYFLVVAQEGHTYHGTYRGGGQEGFMMDIGGQYILGHKKHLAPEQVKTLEIGDRFSFTAPFPQEVQKVLIPKETVPDLTNEELSQRVYQSALVKNSMKNIRTLCKVVYGNKHALQNKLPEFKIPITHEDIEKGEKLAQLIEQSPQSIRKIRGVRVCGLKNSARQHAEANFSTLSHSILGYIYALKGAEREVLASHSAEQKRCAKPVEMPSQNIKKLFFIPREEQQRILSNSPELRIEVQQYFGRLNERLSPSEHEAINEENHIKLAESLGTSISQAGEIVRTVRWTKKSYDIIKELHHKIGKEKERNVRQSVTSSDSKKSIKISTTQMKAENVVGFAKQEKRREQKIQQHRGKSMAI